MIEFANEEIKENVKMRKYKCEECSDNNCTLECKKKLKDFNFCQEADRFANWKENNDYTISSTDDKYSYYKEEVNP